MRPIAFAALILAAAACSQPQPKPVTDETRQAAGVPTDAGTKPANEPGGGAMTTADGGPEDGGSRGDGGVVAAVKEGAAEAVRGVKEGAAACVASKRREGLLGREV